MGVDMQGNRMVYTGDSDIYPLNLWCVSRMIQPGR